MKKLFVLILFQPFFMVCGAIKGERCEPLSKPNLKIPNVNDTKIEDVPWMAVIWKIGQRNNKGKPKCNGMVISRRHVITLATCLGTCVKRRGECTFENFHGVRIVVGSSTWENIEGKKQFKVKQIMVHPEYTVKWSAGEKFHFDNVGVAEAEEDFPDSVKTISIATSMPPNNAWATLTFYSYKNEEKLKSIDVKVYDEVECGEVSCTLDFLLWDTICGGITATGLGSICILGDTYTVGSGPLVYNNSLIGINWWIRKTCALYKNYWPDGYIALPLLADWIKEYVF